MMVDKTKITIVGAGNVGKGVFKAIKHNPDMMLAGIISRDVQRVVNDQPFYDELLAPIYSATDLRAIEKVAEKTDVAILCGGSATDLPKQGPFYSLFFNTVDSFDTHADIPGYDRMMNGVARFHKHTSVISGGWDPGTFSLERVFGDSFIPYSKAYTFWGEEEVGGVSQGHSQAIKALEGVLDAIQYTIPVKEALQRVRNGEDPELTTREKHTRLCYIALTPDADREKVIHAIVNMPKYFEDYDTTVNIESPEQIAERKKEMPHGGFVLTSGKTGDGHRAIIEYSNHWQSNPEATGNILVACARACNRLNKEGKEFSSLIMPGELRDKIEPIYFGSKTMLDIPPAYYSPHSREELLKHWM